MRPDLVILGEYDPDSETHRATDAAIRHSLVGLNAELRASWISTETIKEADIVQAHGLWVAPGSPYKDLSQALQTIRLARENLYHVWEPAVVFSTWSWSSPETCSGLPMPGTLNTIQTLLGFSSAP